MYTFLLARTKTKVDTAYFYGNKTTCKVTFTMRSGDHLCPLKAHEYLNSQFSLKYLPKFVFFREELRTDGNRTF